MFFFYITSKECVFRGTFFCQVYFVIRDKKILIDQLFDVKDCYVCFWNLLEAEASYW